MTHQYNDSSGTIGYFFIDDLLPHELVTEINTHFPDHKEMQLKKSLKENKFMSLDTAEKQKLIETHQVHPTDTGSAEVQIALLSKRISKLSDHLQGNIHDFASRQGLLKMIGKRKRLLSFIKDKNVQRYQELVKKIGIRG